MNFPFALASRCPAEDVALLAGRVRIGQNCVQVPPRFLDAIMLSSDLQSQLTAFRSKELRYTSIWGEGKSH